MKYAADFKQIARDALFGNWRVAILTGFVASLLGGTLTTTGNFGSSSSSSDSSNDSLSELPFGDIGEFADIIIPLLLVILLVALAVGTVTFVLGGATKLGYAKFNLNLIDRKPAAFSDLFSQYNRFGVGFCMDLLMGLYIMLWTLLFIIPGIVKSYSYAMTPYILAENPEMTVNEAITESRRIMNGNRWRLFCLNFSFIGWALLCVVPMFVLMPLAFLGAVGVVFWIVLSIAALIIGSLLLTPYQEAAQAAFYREISYVSVYVPRD